MPYARLGILGSIFLALARALGETMAVTMVIGNDPAIHGSLLAPGYTIASVIANEFAEAGDTLHLSSLVEMGLVLFLITIIVNGAGPTAGDGHGGEGNLASMTRLRYRKAINVVMLTLTGVCTLLTVSVLFVILGFLVWNGATSIDWNFLTKLPLPTGEVGGGMANAIVGSALMVGLASVIGLPIGFFGGIYLAEFGGGKTLFLYRPLYGGPAERRSIDCNRDLRLDGDRSAHARLLSPGRRSGAQPDADPHYFAQHGAVPASRAEVATRGCIGAGGATMESDRHGCGARGDARAYLQE